MHKESNPVEESGRRSWQERKFAILMTGYLVVTGAIFFRISRQPFNQAVKWEQYESAFKATTLAAIVGGIGVGSVQRKSQRRGQNPQDQR